MSKPTIKDSLTLPEHIWLQWHGDGDPKDTGEVEPSEVTWCRDQVFKQDVEYVRAQFLFDLLEQAEAEISALKPQLAREDCASDYEQGHRNGVFYTLVELRHGIKNYLNDPPKES